MNETEKSVLYVVGLVLVGAIAVAGLFYPKLPTLAGASPSGSMFGLETQASISVNLAAPGANATSSSVYNGSGVDRYITSIKAGCEGLGTSYSAYAGAGLAALTLTVATSSASAPATNGNTNDVGGGSLALATATPQFVISSSTGEYPGSGLLSNVWPSGSYLTFTANATNTAACTVGADYVSS